MTTEADDWNARHTTEPNIWRQLQELIAQSGRDEIVIQQQAETIRDLEAKLEAAQKDAAYWKKLYTQLGFSGTPD